MSYQLYQFPISHFCEKARWALDHKGVDYRLCNLVPGLHFRTTTRLAGDSAVPLLVAGDRMAQGSAEIITLLDELVPENPLTPVDANRRGEVLAWEQWLDSELGVDVRLACYFTLLEHPDIVRAYFKVEKPWWGGLFLRLGYGKLSSLMREAMSIDREHYELALRRIDTALERLNQAYSERRYLVGNSFSRADLAAAALVAPLITPSQYGLDWVPAPEPLAGVMRDVAPRLEWARRLYAEQR